MSPLRPGQEKPFIPNSVRYLEVPPPQARDGSEPFRSQLAFRVLQRYPELPEGASGELEESHHGQSSRGPGLAVANKKGG